MKLGAHSNPSFFRLEKFIKVAHFNSIKKRESNGLAKKKLMRCSRLFLKLGLFMVAFLDLKYKSTSLKNKREIVQPFARETKDWKELVVTYNINPYYYYYCRRK